VRAPRSARRRATLGVAEQLGALGGYTAPCRPRKRSGGAERAARPIPAASLAADPGEAHVRRSSLRIVPLVTDRSAVQRGPRSRRIATRFRRMVRSRPAQPQHLFRASHCARPRWLGPLGVRNSHGHHDEPAAVLRPAGRLAAKFAAACTMPAVDRIREVGRSDGPSQGRNQASPGSCRSPHPRFSAPEGLERASVRSSNRRNPAPGPKRPRFAQGRRTR